MANNKKVEKTDVKKIVFEIILIPLCILYLYYGLLYNHPTISTIILYLISFVTCIEFIVKYIKEVYVYKNKYNFLRIIYVIFSFLVIIFGILNIFLKYKFIKMTFVILLICLLCYLLYFAIVHIINIIKGKGRLFTNAFASFFPLLSFVIILMGLIVYLK